jgi:hypothetical protein
VIALNIQVKSCSCINSPDTFLEYFRADYIIFKAQIIAHIEPPENVQAYPRGVTLLKVTEYYTNKLKNNYIIYVNTDGGMCGKSIEYRSPGKEFILKTYPSSKPKFINEKEINELYINSEEISFNYVGFHTCDVGELNVEGDYIEGSISSNPYRKTSSFIAKISKIRQNWGDLLRDYFNKNGYPTQYMKIDRFRRKVKRRWRNI